MISILPHSSLQKNKTRKIRMRIQVMFLSCTNIRVHFNVLKLFIFYPIRYRFTLLI
ncbi:hypothetical protein BCAH1134_C0110 (plasmid) [Bacillus cereus AH1134]|nr:hypothetical protein BCAH1134_C0110 [Bacillus cereus AH1134]